jgi:hypothetical protein
MKTYPFVTDNGQIKAFEISNAFFWAPGTMRRVLESVEGVTNVRRIWFSDDRYSFIFRGHRCVVNEPWGDNSMYWIGPEQMEPPVDMTPVHEAFRRYRFPLTFDRESRG